MNSCSRNYHIREESGYLVCKDKGCHKLNVFDWMKDLPETKSITDIVEVRFKNTRKGYYRNINRIQLKTGDIVAVEAAPGHDIGIITTTGALVVHQLKKSGIESSANEFKKIYRKAKPADIEKWKEAMSHEYSTMLRARQIANSLNLEMKIGDVEYQGDKTKAIFYYIADERVDFRELIKLLAEEFDVRIEMRQIGARQEAGRIGGIGSCGREICCSTHISNFISVSTNAARYQELSLNPQKLAGQCSKLKCCLNFELDSYLDARQSFPDTSIPLETTKGTLFHQKTDIYKRIFWYSFEKETAINLIPIPVERVLEIIEMNKNGIKTDQFIPETISGDSDELSYTNAAGQESVTRFDDKKKYRPNISRKDAAPSLKLKSVRDKNAKD
ncbi:MAG: hypothetical protein HY738_01585 [Bacteroidia bacterium]|nr:hypothetical protein [Bacteroidia bacterium]